MYYSKNSTTTLAPTCHAVQNSTVTQPSHRLAPRLINFISIPRAEYRREGGSYCQDNMGPNQYVTIFSLKLHNVFKLLARALALILEKITFLHQEIQIGKKVLNGDAIVMLPNLMILTQQC